MRVTVVVNPIAGTGRRPGSAERRVALARAILEREGAAGEVRVTAGPEDAVRLAREAVGRGAALVVAWGGDGTVNEVGRALAFGPVPLGIVPAGSGNGLARELGVPRDPAAALRAALAGAERAIDAGEIDGRLFFNAAGIGLDAEVAARFAGRGQARRGFLAYVAVAVRALWTYRAQAYGVRVDDEERVRLSALVLVCANSRQYGNGAIVAPQARVDDGALDLVVVAPRSPLAALWQARRLFTGSFDGAPGVVIRRFARLEVAGDAPLGFHVDGDPAAGGPRLAVRVHPGALRVRVPG